MQNLTKRIEDAKQKKRMTENEILNLIREYLQVLILKAIYQSKYGKGLSFMGGTCLRICYDFKRFSEDLDFALNFEVPGYSFSQLNRLIISFLKNTNFEVEMNTSEDKTVQKSFIKISNVLHVFSVSPIKSQKLHVKLEVDTKPVRVTKEDIETFFVTKFNETFPILKHTDETLFAGKICAVLNRTYTKGRDFYDLIWYLRRGTTMNLTYLNHAFKQAGLVSQFKNEKKVMQALTARIAKVNTSDILKDIGKFLEDPTEETWLKDYPAVFEQMAKRF